MKKYYYMLNGVQKGPYSIEDLKGNIKADQFVWCEGMSEWKKANEVDELKELFKSTPPPFIQPHKQGPPPFSLEDDGPRNNNWKKWTVISGLTLLIIAAIMFIYRNQTNNEHSPNNITTDVVNPNNPDRELTPAEIKEALRQTELKTPTGYLRSKVTNWRRTFTGKYEVEGSFTNIATVATYKDINYEVTLLSETDKVLNRHLYTQLKYIRPGETIPYTLKCDGSRFTKKVNVRVLSAIAVQ